MLHHGKFRITVFVERKRGVIRVIPLLAISLLGCTAIAQNATTTPNASSLLRTTSTFVSVPTLVRSALNEPVRNMSAGQFRLFDEKIPQQVVMERTDDLPIALVLLVQTGSSAGRQFASYADFPVLLKNLLAHSEHEITLVTFDSKIEQIWHFPAHSDGMMYEMTHLNPGDNGAAIRDAVHFGVQQLEAEPGRFRRVVLLLSQNTDQGSATSAEELLKQLGTSSTIVYSLIFPGLKAHHVSRHNAASFRFSGTFGRAIQGLNNNTAAEIAAITGGDCTRFNDQRSFNSAFLETSIGIRDSYMLGFQPNRHSIGFHSIQVELAKPNPDLSILARSVYWFNSTAADE